MDRMPIIIYCRELIYQSRRKIISMSFSKNMQEKNLSDSGTNQAIVKMYTVKFIDIIYLPNILKKVLLLYMV